MVLRLLEVEVEAGSRASTWLAHVLVLMESPWSCGVESHGMYGCSVALGKELGSCLQYAMIAPHFLETLEWTWVDTGQSRI